MARSTDWIRGAVTWIRSRADGDGRLTLWAGADRARVDDRFGGVAADHCKQRQLIQRTGKGYDVAPAGI